MAIDESKRRFLAAPPIPQLARAEALASIRRTRLQRSLQEIREPLRATIPSPE
jgi:hypothetical protein